MAIWAVTGKVGSGKNLYAMRRVMEYAFEGRRVVANYAVDLRPVQPMLARLLGRECPEVERIPSRPTYEDLQGLGKGGPREHRAGLLVLDECGPLFDARNWQHADRAKLVNWLLHSRKLAWDVMLIVQNIGLIDKQIRIACIESCVSLRRLDRLKLLGVSLPRLHLAVERYGTEPGAPIANRQAFRGNRLFATYDTMELFGQELADQTGAGAAGMREAPPAASAALVSDEAKARYAEIGEFLKRDAEKAKERVLRLLQEPSGHSGRVILGST